MNRFLLEEAKRLGFNLTRNEWGGIKSDFQLLGYRFVTGYYNNKHIKKEKINGLV